MLANLPAQSVDCIVTSPPYWAKRDYRVVGQYGHEPDPVGYVATLQAVFREARRVLADDGTCWLNLGDSYSSGGNSPTGLHTYLGPRLSGRHAPGIESKNLLGLPWRVALALQDDGWILRNAIIWHKPNAMPESVRDRLSCRYELVFLLVKSRRYWFDLDAIRIPHTSKRPATQPPKSPRTTRRPTGPPASGRRPGGNRQSSTRPPKYNAYTPQVVGAQRYGSGRCRSVNPKGRNPGDVWDIPTRPYLGPHFAAFPVDLPTRCIKAGCRPGGLVLDMFCGTGTTGLAALALGRRFTGIELSSAFAALAAERLRQASQSEPSAGTT